MKTLNIEEAAKFLGAHKETVRRLAVTGIIPGAKIGRGWMFIEQDLVTHMRNKYSTCDASQGVHNRSNEIWHSKEKMVFGGLSSLTAENVYEKVLKLK
ncbi:MAG: helix-turn-helix domain-containing protein [Gammaproteobacteria bacterium]